MMSARCRVPARVAEWSQPKPASAADERFRAHEEFSKITVVGKSGFEPVCGVCIEIDVSDCRLGYQGIRQPWIGIYCRQYKRVFQRGDPVGGGPGSHPY